MEEFIPLSIPNFEGNEEKYVMDAVQQGWVSTGGAYITELENKLAKFLNVEKSVACQSGTSALHLAIMECDVKPNDMVIVPTLTFIAAVNPVRYQFANPIFMDCDDSLCMNPVKLQEFCENECDLVDAKLVYRKTKQIIKAILVVHVFGNLADMERIMKIAKQYNLRVIEDATEALGTKYIAGEYAGKMAGTIGDFGAYSFNGNKIITTGGGGAVVAKNIDKLNHIQYISTQAKDDTLYYIHNEVGYNYRMTNLQAALGVAQLECLPEFIERKNRNYDYYQKLFKEKNMNSLLAFRDNTFSNKWFYSYIISEDRDLREIIETLAKEKIQTRPIWGLIHEQLPYGECVAYKIKKAKYYSKRVLNIPCSTNLKLDDIARVVESLYSIK